jgi:hypothetical protein
MVDVLALNALCELHRQARVHQELYPSGGDWPVWSNKSLIRIV